MENSPLIWLAATWQLERYVLIAGTVFCVCGFLIKFGLYRGKRQQKPWKSRILRHEIIYSSITSIVFGWAIITNSFIGQAGYSQMYFRIEDYGLFYFFTSFLVGLIVHDAYFYWSHRFLHTISFLRRFHATHHRSRNPSALAALSFSPIEAVIHSSFSVFFLTFVPVHPIPFAFITTMYLVSSAIGHSGIELYPRWFAYHSITRHLATPTHHDLHHQFGSCNYAIYFTWWDRVMGTEHPEYLKYVAEGVEAPPRSQNLMESSQNPSTTIGQTKFSGP